MNGINRVFLMGFLGADPEKLTSKKGKSYVRLSVSTHHNKRLENGSKEKTTTWHRVAVFGKTAENCEKSLSCGSALAVEGYLSKYVYEKEDGTEAQATSIVAQQVHFLGRKRETNEAFSTDAMTGSTLL
jgi:single-strand DNA-binding protein